MATDDYRIDRVKEKTMFNDADLVNQIFCKLMRIVDLSEMKIDDVIVRVRQKQSPLVVFSECGVQTFFLETFKDFLTAVRNNFDWKREPSQFIDHLAFVNDPHF